MFNVALSKFIQDYYNGSRTQAGKAVGCSGKVIGQMLRGDMSIPLMRAFLIEEASKSEILVEDLIAYQDPLLAKTIKQFRHRCIYKAREQIRAGCRDKQALKA